MPALFESGVPKGSLRSQRPVLLFKWHRRRGLFSKCFRLERHEGLHVVLRCAPLLHSDVQMFQHMQRGGLLQQFSLRRQDSIPVHRGKCRGRVQPQCVVLANGTFMHGLLRRQKLRETVLYVHRSAVQDGPLRPGLLVRLRCRAYGQQLLQQQNVFPLSTGVRCVL